MFELLKNWLRDIQSYGLSREEKENLKKYFEACRVLADLNRILKKQKGKKISDTKLAPLRDEISEARKRWQGFYKKVRPLLNNDNIT